jgi:hypothetical protein
VRLDLLPSRICEECGREYEPSHPAQRWCDPTCRDEYRAAELRAARKMWAQAGKPKAVLEECRATEVQR